MVKITSMATWSKKFFRKQLHIIQGWANLRSFEMDEEVLLQITTAHIEQPQRLKWDCVRIPFVLVRKEYSPYQNGKQESFWGQLEGRLMSMLSRVEPLTLETLNYTTQAWSEMEYNRKGHQEINCSPVDKMLEGPDSSRPAHDSEKMIFAFTIQESRAQRKSDGTLQIKGVRFEVPSRFRHFDRLHIRYKRWNLSQAWLVDERDSTLLAKIYPQDKLKNGEGLRRTLAPMVEDLPKPDNNTDPYPPLLRKLLGDYAATGVPPAYIPMEADNE